MWEAWLIIAILLTIAEIYFSGLFLLWFLIGALVTLISSLFLHNLVLETIIFLITSLTLRLALTQYFTLKFTIKKNHSTNTNKLIGSHGLVIKSIGQNNLETGLVKLDGEAWPAISNSRDTIPKGSLVEVKDIKGVRLVVASTKKKI